MGQHLAAKAAKGERCGDALKASRGNGHCLLELAKALDTHPDVKMVKYPFLPSHPQH